MKISEEQIISAIRTFLNEDSLEIKVDINSSFIEDIGMDSVAQVAFMFFCEEKFGIGLLKRAGEISRVETVKDALHLMNN